MKVTGEQPPRTRELATGKSRQPEPKGVHAGERSRTGAEESAAVGRNRTSLTLNRIKEAIRNTPDVRADRVAEVREQIVSGKFKVDAERLATNMLTESLREDVEKP